MTNSINKQKTCCFTGHRPYAFPWGSDVESDAFKKFKARLEDAIDRAICQGFTHFIAGNALGVDSWAAQIIVEKKRTNPAITLEIALPFEGHNAKLFSKKDADMLAVIHNSADIVHVVSTAQSHTKAYIERDRYMVDNSSRLIAVYDEDDDIKGGAYRTLEYAKKCGIAVDEVAWTDILYSRKRPSSKHQHRHTFEIIVGKNELLWQIGECDSQHNLIDLIVAGKNAADYKANLMMVALKFQHIGSLTYRVKGKDGKFKPAKLSLQKYKRFFENYCEAEWEMRSRLFGIIEDLEEEEDAIAHRAYEKYYAVKYYCVPLLCNVAENYGADTYAHIIDYIISEDNLPLLENGPGKSYVREKLRKKYKAMDADEDEIVKDDLLIFDPWELRF